MTKEAGATVYLMEELGDARMRCDQLVRYIAEAVKLIETSGQKDQLFEVGGHLLQAIPDTLFRLQKALQAVALAAGRIDYEELKQDLKPEKVKQLEDVLQDVRIRQVQRRSQPWTPEQVAQKLQMLAAQATKEGSISPAGLIDVILGLEVGGEKNAAAEDTAATLNQLADSLQAGEPSRLILAAALRRMLGDAQIDMAKETTMDRDAARYSGDPVWIHARYPGTADDGTPFRKGEEVLYWPRTKTFMVGAKAQAAWRKFQSEIEDEAFYNMQHMATTDEEKESRFEEGKPADPTKNMSPEDKAKWKKQKEEHKDQFKGAATRWFEMGKWYKLTFRNGDEVYFHPQEQLKHGGFKGLQVAYDGETGRARKAVQKTVQKNEANMWTEVKESDLSKDVKSKFNARMAYSFDANEVQQLGSEEEVRKKFRAENPDITEAEMDKIVSQWKAKKEAAWKVDAFAMGDLNLVGHLERMVDTTERQLKEMKHSLDLFKRDPQKYAPQATNFGQAVRQIMSTGRMALRTLGYKEGYSFSSDDEEKESRFEEGKPADPTENMSPEDKAKWKKQNEENKDKFKKDADTISPDTERLSFAMDAIFTAARRGMNFAKQGNRRRAFLALVDVTQALTTLVALEGGNPNPANLLRKELLMMSRQHPTAEAPLAPVMAWKKDAGAREALKFVELNGKLQKLVRSANRGEGLDWLQEAYNVLAEYAWLFRGDRWALQRFNPVIDEVQGLQHAVASLGSTLKTLGAIIKKNELAMAEHLNPNEQMTEPEWKAFK